MKKEDIVTLVYEAVGEASMCWKETPKGEFDSTKASIVADKLLEDIIKESQKIMVHLEDNHYSKFIPGIINTVRTIPLCHFKATVSPEEHLIDIELYNNKCWINQADLKHFKENNIELTKIEVIWFMPGTIYPTYPAGTKGSPTDGYELNVLYTN